MIRWIIVLLSVSAGSSLTEVNHPTGPIKNDTKDSYLPQFDSSSTGFKPKRQLDDFDFDAGSFDASSAFPIKKINGLTSFDDEDSSADYSAPISVPSFKVIRSNSDSLGIRNQNYDSSIKYEPQQQQDVQQENYSNESPNTALNSQAPTSYYKPVVQQQNYPVYNFKQLPVHPITSGYVQNQASTQSLPYKTIFGQGLKTSQPNAKVYAPSHHHNLQQQQPFQAHFQNFAQNPYDIQYTTASTDDINNKKLSLPIVQLQSAQDGYLQGYGSLPGIFGSESGLQYKNQPAFNIPFEYAKPKTFNQRSAYSAPFLNQQTLGQIQVVPFQSSTSTPNIPKFKGASVAQYPQKSFSKIPNDYQDFKAQTQLHFGGNTNDNNNKQQVIHTPAKPFERIRTDVEVIDKKKPIPPLPKNDDDDEGNDDDDESGEVQSKDSYLPRNEDDDGDSRKYNFKESELESDFKPSKSYPFKEYEAKFSKPSKKTSNDDDDDDDEEEKYDTDVDLAAKYRYLSKSEDDDDDDENESGEDKPRSKYKSYPIENSYKNYNDDDDNDDDDDKEEGGESKKLERKEKAFDFDRKHPTKRGKPRKERRKAVNDETSEPTKKKQSKPKYSQNRSKGSNESRNRPRSHQNTPRHETSERNSKRQRRRPYRDETGEPLNRATKFSKNFSPEIQFEGTTTSARSSSSTEDYRPKGHDFHLDDGGQSTFSKEEVSVTDSYGNPRKSTTSAPLPHTTRSHKTAGDQRTSRKSSGVKTKPIVVDSYNKPVSSGLRALVHSKPSYFTSDVSHDDNLRRLKGI